MKQIKYVILVTLATMSASVHAQEKSVPTATYGYLSKSSEYYLEPAEYAVYYKRTQLVINEQTKEKDYQTDTLALIIGQRWSVFYNTTYNSRYSSWGKQNIKKTRQATKPISLQSVPLSSVLDKKNVASDYVEGSFGEPTVIYTDRFEKKTYSVLYAPMNIKNEQDSGSSFEWKLNEAQDTVFSYPCKRADLFYSGRDYTAWYAPEIPIPDGPWKFYGLPGLILKIEDKERCFLYEVLGIESLNSPSYISMNDNLEKVSLPFFNQVANNARSVKRGSFLFEGELFFTETRPFVYNEMELSDE